MRLMMERLVKIRMRMKTVVKGEDLKTIKKTFPKKFNLGKALLPASLSGLGLNHS